MRSHVILAVLLSACATAHPTASHVEVTSQRWLFNPVSQELEHLGHVVVNLGDYTITGERLRTLRTDNGELAGIEVEGQPASVSSKHEAQHGHADRIMYSINEERLILDGHAKLQHHHDTFTGNRVEYHTTKQTIDSTSTPTSRPTFVLPDLENRLPVGEPHP